MLNLPTHVWLRTPVYLFPELLGGLGPWLTSLLFSVLLCSLLVPIRVLSLPRDPMTGSPPLPLLSLSHSSESGFSLETRASPRGISEELSKYSSTRGGLFATGCSCEQAT